MIVLDFARGLASTYGLSHLTDAELEAVIWTCTGYPAFFATPEGWDGLDVFRIQLITAFKNVQKHSVAWALAAEDAKMMNALRRLTGAGE